MKIIFSLLLLIGMFATLIGQTFTEVAVPMGLIHKSTDNSYTGAGVAFFNFNNDEYDDIYVSGGINADKIFINNAGLSFTEAINTGIELLTQDVTTNGIAAGDIDNDGDDDLYISAGTFGGHHDFLMENNGDGTFTEIGQFSDLDLISEWTTAATMGDYNLDGYLDIYTGGYVRSGGLDEITNAFIYEGWANKLYYNNGDNTFTETAKLVGLNDIGNALATASTDFDLDNDIDIYLANDFGQWNSTNQLFQNNYPNNTWTNTSIASGADIGIFAMGIAVGDYDEDGDFDYYVTNLGRNVLLNNNGDGTFSDLATMAGVENTNSDALLSTSWGTAFIDLDNDSYLDLYVSNGQIPAAEFIATNIIDPNKLYHNNADGSFTDITASAGVDFDGRSRGLAYGDFDNDGDIDLLVGNIYDENALTGNCLLYRNDSNTNSNWLKVTLQGQASNRNGYGAKGIIHAGGRRFIREMDGGSSHNSSHAAFMHFGLANINAIDSAFIIWPGGLQQPLGQLEVNQTHHILESTCQPNYDGLNTLTGSPSANITYDTNGKIASTQAINQSIEVNYKSLETIELKSGFEVEPSAIFHATIEGCENDP